MNPMAHKEHALGQAVEKAQAEPAMPVHMHARLEAFREELGHMILGELGSVEREFETEISRMSKDLKALSDSLTEARAEATRRATDLARAKMDHSSERDRFGREVQRLERLLQERDLAAADAKKRADDAARKLHELETDMREKVVSLEALERRFNDEIAARDRHISELESVNQRFETKLNALLEVQRKLDETLGRR